MTQKEPPIKKITILVEKLLKNHNIAVEYINNNKYLGNISKIENMDPVDYINNIGIKNIIEKFSKDLDTLKEYKEYIQVCNYKPKRFGISISTYSNPETPKERLKIVERCLDSIKEQVYDKFDKDLVYVNVVSDTVTYEHEKLLQKYPFARIKNIENMGIWYTKNVGIKCILDNDCDFGFLLDDDVIINDGIIFKYYLRAMELTGYHHFTCVTDESCTVGLTNKNGINLRVLSNAHGFWLTFTRKSIEKTGYFNKMPYKAGYEHPLFAEKNINFGQIPHRVDIVNPNRFLNISNVFDCSTSLDNPNRKEECMINTVVGGKLHKTIEFFDLDPEKTHIFNSLDRNVKFIKIFDFLDRIYFINLEHRKDRLESVLNQIKKIDPDMEKTTRFEAVKRDPGWIGCAASHLKILEECIEKDYDNVLILEDDFIFKNEDSVEALNFLINQYNTSYNMFMVGRNLLKMVNKIPENISEIYDKYGFVEVHDAQTTSGYIISKRLMKPLYEVWKKGLDNLEKNPKNQNGSCDIIWKIFQGKDKKIYTTKKGIGGQLPGYSDIEKRDVTYNC